MDTTTPTFYVTGGTLRHDAASYIERRADVDLYDALQRGDFCYVLTARQMGKSSLMARTAARLRAQGVGVAILDLTAMGTNVTPEQWYQGLLGELGARLDLEDELEAFWWEHASLGPLRRWMEALREVVLDGLPGPLVIFIDEIDVVKSLSFSTDEFFAAIRECYNRRTEDPELARLTFCLLGVATPSDLIRDVRMTPFNIGKRIELTDFTEAEAAPLAAGLVGTLATESTEGTEEEVQEVLRRVLYWTDGHPYLTQRLCRAIVEVGSVATSSEFDPSSSVFSVDSVAKLPSQLVDRLCEELFLSTRAREEDDNLLFVRERLLHSEADVATLLDLYARVRQGKQVRDDEANPLVSLLRLSGITRTAGARRQAPGASPEGRRWEAWAMRLAAFTGAWRLTPDACLVVRNRIYERVFDRQWIATHMPDAELRRQRAAYRRGLTRAATVSGLVLAVVGGLALTAVNQARRADRVARLEAQQRRLVQEREQTGRRYLYVAQMKLAQQAWEEGNVARAQELLEAWRPEPQQEDLRGYEWRLLWQLCQDTALFTFPQRPLQVTGVAFSPDGHTLASSTSEGAIQLWDLRAKDQHPPGGFIISLRGHKETVTQVTFSPDGQTLASSSTDQTVRLWDVAARREVARLPGHGRPVRAVAFSPDGSRLASAGEDGTVRLWNMAARKEIVLLRADAAVINSVAFAPDGRVLASAGTGGTVQLWDLAARKVTMTFTGHTDAVNAVAFAPRQARARLLASASVDGTVKLWDPALKREVGTLWGHRSAIRCLAFSPNGKSLVTGSGDQTVRLWDLAAKKEVTTLKGHRAGISSVAFSPDGKTIASGSDDRTIKLWDPAAKGDTITVLRPRGTPGRAKGPASAVALSPDGKTLATAHPDGTVELWDIVHPAHRSEASDQRRSAGPGQTQAARVIATLQAHAARIDSLKFSPDGKTLATGSQDQTVKLWERRDAGSFWQHTATLPGFAGGRYGMAFAPKGKVLALRSSDGVKVWDLASWRAIAALKAPPSDWNASGDSGLDFSPDGQFLVECEPMDSAKLWNVATWQVVATLKGRVGHPPVFSPDGTVLACEMGYGGNPAAVTLWDLAARRVVATLKGHASGSGDLAFSPDGKTLAVSSANTITLYNIPVRQPVATLKGHTGPVNVVTFSRDGTTLASAAGDGTIRLWHAATGQEADRLKVVATGGDRRVRLQWFHSSAPAYNIYRGPAGARRAELTRLTRRPVVETSFIDQSPALVNGRAQTYAVAGVFPDVEGKRTEGHPVLVPATPVAAPPGFWGCSINEGGNTGSARFDAASGRVTVLGSGWDVWEDADGFYFLSQPVTGDFRITVEALTRPTGSYWWAQAGLMVRETLDTGARNSFLLTSAGQGLQHKWRPTVNEAPDFEDVLSDSGLKLPIVLRITRQGNRIIPTYSRDNGGSFQPAGDPVLFVPALAKTLYAGLAITSHEPTEISEARYRNLVVTKP